MKIIDYKDVIEFYNNMNLHQKEYLITLLSSDLSIVITSDGQHFFEPNSADIGINGTKVQILITNEEN